MNVKFYFDVHVSRAITQGLRLRSIDVLTAQEDGAQEVSDPELLDRATHLNRVLFTQDSDFLKEASERLRKGKVFSGIVYAHQLNIGVSQCVADLELISRAVQFNELANQVIYLPLR